MTLAKPIIGGLLSLLAGAFLMISPAMAQYDDPCRNPRELPTVMVEVEARTERTSARYTADELHRYANRQDPLPVGYRHFGFTEMGREIRIRAQVRSGTDEYKNFCFSPETITVTVKVAPVMYVPGEYPRTSCPAGAVRVHELLHLQIHEDALQELPGRIERALELERELRITRKARDKRHAIDLVRDLSLEVARRAARELDAEYRIRHLELDSPQSFRANLGICGEAEWAGLMD